MAHHFELPFESHFLTISGIRVHYLDEGKKEDPPVFFIHGVPTWSYTFRNIIPEVARAGYRVIALDLPGFGLSEKSIPREKFTMQWLVSIAGEFMETVEKRKAVLYAHDWGVFIGLMLASRPSSPFSALVLSNGFLPTAGMTVPGLFRIWRVFARYSPLLSPGWIVDLASNRRLSRMEKAGYNRPFGSQAEKRAIRWMPGLVPLGRKHRNYPDLIAVWEKLLTCTTPTLTLFSSGDPITRGLEKIIQERIPGTKNQEHHIFPGGHFLQEDVPEEIARELIRFLKHHT